MNHAHTLVARMWPLLPKWSFPAEGAAQWALIGEAVRLGYGHADLVTVGRVMEERSGNL